MNVLKQEMLLPVEGSRSDPLRTRTDAAWWQGRNPADRGGKAWIHAEQRSDGAWCFCPRLADLGPRFGFTLAVEPRQFATPVAVAGSRYRNSFQSIFIWAEFDPADVAVTVVLAAKSSGVPPGDDLGCVVAAVRVSMAVTQTDTDGRQLRQPAKPINRLIEAVRPQIEAVVATSGVACSDREDCVQEVWIEVLAGIVRVDPSASRGSLHGWLSTITRRTAWRFLSRQRRSEAIPLGAEAESLIADSTPTDPAELCQQRETQHHEDAFSSRRI